MRAMKTYLVAMAVLIASCATAKDSVEMQQMRFKLQQTTFGSVETIAERDEHSRILEEVLDSGAMDDQTREGLRDTLGQPKACIAPICTDQGFTREDWYFEIGVNANPEVIKQMPLLIASFDSKGRVARIYTLTTHD